MEQAITKIPVEQAYDEVKNLIYDTVWNFKRKYGGDFDDLLSDANLAFMQVYKSFNKDKATFPTWIRFKIWKELLEMERIGVVSKKPQIVCETGLESLDSPTQESRHDIDILDSLKDDLRYIVDIVRDPLAASQLFALYQKEHKDYKSMVGVLTRHLKQDLGWTSSRIQKNFCKIKRILKNNF